MLPLRNFPHEGEGPFINTFNMKKLFTLAALAFAFLSAGAQTTKNLFPATVTDANGWLWFNSQSVIDTYVGDIDTSDPVAFRIDVNGKPIQKVFADQQPDYPEATADPTITGAGTDGETGTAGAHTGAIILPPAKGFGAINGGGIAFKLPALATLSICLSSNSKIIGRLTATTNAQNDIFKFVNDGNIYPLNSDKGFKVIQVYSLFKKLAGAGVKEWTGLENLHNGTDPTTIKSDAPIYVFFQNGNRDTVYVHGVKITVPVTASGISTVAASVYGKTAVYTVDGRFAGTALTGLRQGVHMVRENGKTRKVVIR